MLVTFTVKAQTFEHNVEQLIKYVEIGCIRVRSEIDCESEGRINYDILDDVVYSYEADYGLLFPRGATGSEEELQQFKNFRTVIKDKQIVASLLQCYLYLEKVYLRTINKMMVSDSSFELHKLQYLLHFIEDCYKASGKLKEAKEVKKRRKEYRVLEYSSEIMSNLISKKK